MYKKINSIFITYLCITASLLLLFTARAAALDPGCYRGGGSADRPTYLSTACPTEGYARAVAQFDHCYLVITSTNVQQIDCDTQAAVQPDPDDPTAGSSPEAPVGPSADTVDTSSIVQFEEGDYQCGTGDNAVSTTINLGCKGAEIEATGESINPIVDMAFALFRFLSAGVGLVVIGSIIVAGIQYSSSRGNPQATEAAIKRVTNAVTGLVLYIFIFAIANFLVPGGLFI